MVYTEEAEGRGCDWCSPGGSALDICIQQVQRFIVPCVAVNVLCEVGESDKERGMIETSRDDDEGL